MNSKRFSSNVFLFEELVLNTLIALPLMKLYFYAWWVAQGEVHELEVHGQLVVILDVQDGIFSESFPFKPKRCLHRVLRARAPMM